MEQGIKLYAFEHSIGKATLDLYITGKRGSVISASDLKKCFDDEQDDIAQKLIPLGCASYKEIYENAFDNADNRLIHKFLKALRKLDQFDNQQSQETASSTNDQSSYCTANYSPPDSVPINDDLSVSELLDQTIEPYNLSLDTVAAQAKTTRNQVYVLQCNEDLLAATFINPKKSNQWKCDTIGSIMQLGDVIVQGTLIDIVMQGSQSQAFPLIVFLGMRASAAQTQQQSLQQAISSIELKQYACDDPMSKPQKITKDINTMSPFNYKLVPISNRAAIAQDISMFNASLSRLNPAHQQIDRSLITIVETATAKHFNDQMWSIVRNHNTAIRWILKMFAVQSADQRQMIRDYTDLSFKMNRYYSQISDMEF